MSADDREAFVRWQSVTRQHFSAVSNLVLGLSTGLLAFSVSGVASAQITSVCLLVFSTGSMILLAISVALAVWCAINRLRDFRATAKIVRARWKGEPSTSNDRQETRALGDLSWRLFWWQLVLFGFGAAGVVVTVIIQMWL